MEFINQNVRTVDPLGRIVLPASIRQKLNIHEGDRLYVTCVDSGIRIEKHNGASICHQSFKIKQSN